MEDLDKTNEIYEQKLDEALVLLKACQVNKNIKSCFGECDNFLDCKTRETYIASVYNSMNKGVVGGFEF